LILFSFEKLLSMAYTDGSHMANPYRADLRFNSYDQLLTDVQTLHTAGWEKSGQWSLAMICDHLAKWIDGMFDQRLPHVPKPFQWIARFVMHRMARKNKYTALPIHAPASLKPVAEISEPTAIANLTAAIARLQQLSGPIVETHPFGPIPAEDFRGLTLLHAAHHLAFLKPK
jgi:hypothetical protein